MRASGEDKGRTDDRKVDFPHSESPSNRIVISRGKSVILRCSDHIIVKSKKVRKEPD